MTRRSIGQIRWIGIVVMTLLAALLFAPVQQALMLVVAALGATWKFLIDLISITLIAILFAGFLAPLEALGWWAGWYGDEIETIQNPGTLVEPFPTHLQIVRYVVYLDGISQAQFGYLPEVERFLDALALDLPDEIVLIKGIMSYSVLNKPLTDDRWLAFFWRLADRLQMNPSAGIVGALIAATINIRNILIVSVAADQRYGPIYNRGTAQIIYNSLKSYGYPVGSGLPITLLGYSGGAQMAMGAAPYLKRSLQAPIEVISLSGVLSGNHNFLELEHLYHIVGGKDWVEKEGPIMFPRRWKLFVLSYWNRAKRRGKISLISLGKSIGHNGAQGPYGYQAYLPDGRTHLEQTVRIISDIIQDKSPLAQHTVQMRPSNYEYYQQALFNRPSYYPLNQTVDPEWYRAIAPWVGRLMLPSRSQRHHVRGVWFEVHHAPPEYQHLIGQIVLLRWSSDPPVRAFLRTVTKDLHFSDEAKYSQHQGCIHPNRIDHWQRVDPLESLAGSRPYDDMIVRLHQPIVAAAESLDAVDSSNGHARSAAPTLFIDREPVQITGRFYGLVRILAAVDELDVGFQSSGRPDVPAPERFRVVHFNPASRQFDGLEEIVRLPQVIFAQHYGCFPSTTQGIEKSPANVEGWYIYGAKDAAGLFTVQAIAPRGLLRLQPDRVIVGRKPSWHYLKQETWQERAKGTMASVLLCPNGEGQTVSELVNQWQEGDRALLIHVYGGIGGKCKEPAATGPVFFGHFAYGVATVVQEPLAHELRFEIEYHQVYTHNVDGIIAGTLAWNRFLGDRQFGWLGTRPVCDLLIKLDAFTDDYELNGVYQSALQELVSELEEMTARYRIGDGTGGTYVGPAHNCAQDSNQALYAALKDIQGIVGGNLRTQEWLLQNPDQAQRFQQLVKLTRAIKRELLPFGTARADWQNDVGKLGISPEEDVLTSLRMGLISWRTLLPRLASETVAKLFLQQGASIWVLRTNQVGGYDADIEPIAPTPIGC